MPRPSVSPSNRRGALPISAIVLAAGSSQRMGRPKQLLALGGRSILQTVVDEVAGVGFKELLLLLGDHAEDIAATLVAPPQNPLRLLVNEDFACGQSSSLRLALSHADPGSDAAAVFLADQPGIAAAVVARVAAAFANSDRPVARPLYGGEGCAGVPGHPVFIRRSLWPEIESLRGDAGLRSLLPQHPEWLLPVAVDCTAPLDIDTPDDYARAGGKDVGAAGSVQVAPVAGPGFVAADRTCEAPATSVNVASAAHSGSRTWR